MAKGKKSQLLNNKKEPIYPVTSAELVYMEDGTTVDKILKNIISRKIYVKSFEDFSKAIESLDDNDEIILMNDIDVIEKYSTDKKFTLNLNNNRITFNVGENACFTTSNEVVVKNGTIEEVSKGDFIVNTKRCMPKFSNVTFIGFNTVFTNEYTLTLESESNGYVENCKHINCGGNYESTRNYHCYKCYGYRFIDEMPLNSIVFKNNVFENCKSSYWFGYMKSVEITGNLFSLEEVSEANKTQYANSNCYMVEKVVIDNNKYINGFSGATVGKHCNNVIIANNVIENTFMNGLFIDCRMGHCDQDGTNTFRGNWNPNTEPTPNINEPNAGDYVIVAENGYSYNMYGRKYFKKGDRVYYNLETTNNFNWFVDYPSCNGKIYGNTVLNSDKIYIQASDVDFYSNEISGVMNGVRINGGVRNLIHDNVFNTPIDSNILTVALRGEARQYNNTIINKGNYEGAILGHTNGTVINDEVLFIDGIEKDGHHKLSLCDREIFVNNENGRVYLYLPTYTDKTATIKKVFKVYMMTPTSFKTTSNRGTINGGTQLNILEPSLYYIYLNSDGFGYKAVKISSLT